MKNNRLDKLVLHRETLATLSPDALGGVAGGGGFGNLTRLISQAVCSTRTTVAAGAGQK